MNRLLTKTEDIMALSDKIRNCNVIKKHDKPGSKRDPEAWVIAYSLSEIEESCYKIVANLLEKLIAAETPEKTMDVLYDIGIELKHIIYHINDSKFFKDISK